MTFCVPCQPKCDSECSPTQECTLTTNDCQSCQPAVCREKQQAIKENVDITATSLKDSSNNKTALIAGLVTGFVVLFLILATFAAFVYYKRRQRRKLHNTDNEKTAAELPPPPISETALDINPWQTVDYNHPDSPFIFGAQSLQIPHLDSPDPILIRRSLNDIPATTTSNNASLFLNRSSSVKVTKYDHRSTPAINDDDEELKLNKPKRAVSVKKNNSMASSVTRVGSVTEDIKMVKPKVVRINTITRKEGDITRKRSFRTEIEPTPHVLTMQTANSSSTIGDGEITVYWEPSP